MNWIKTLKKIFKRGNKFISETQISELKSDLDKEVDEHTDKMILKELKSASTIHLNEMKNRVKAEALLEILRKDSNSYTKDEIEEFIDEISLEK